MAAQGAKPALTYGVAVIGATSQQLDRARSLLATMAFGVHGGSSITLKYMLSRQWRRDPFCDDVTLPICMWAKAAWKPGCPDRQMTVAFDYALKHPDDDINGLAGRGLAHATLQAMRSLGWTAD